MGGGGYHDARALRANRSFLTRGHAVSGTALDAARDVDGIHKEAGAGIKARRFEACVAKSQDGCYTDVVGRVKRVARVIDPLQWPDSAAEDLLYWITRPPHERVQFGRELVETSYRRVHEGRFPRMNKTGRMFEPEA